MSDLALRIARLLPKFRYRFSRETELHEGLSRVLTDAGIDHVREFVAGPADRFDLLCGRVVIEAKVKGSAAQALQQVGRYCACDDVDAVVLVSSKSWAIEPQLTINGKPVYAVKIGAGL